MATYTNNGLSALNYWFTRDVTSISSATASLVVLVNTDGSETRLLSAGNDLTFTSVAGVITLTGGTITSMLRTTSGGASTLESVSGLAYAAATFQSHIADTTLQGVASEIFAGADTFNGGSLNDFFRGFAGNDTFNGGAGFDTVSYGAPQMTGPISVVFSNTSTVTGGATIGTDTLNSIEAVQGTSGADTFNATAQFSASNGDFNEFEGLGGNDSITGNGNTRLSFANNGSSGVSVTWTGANGGGSATGTNSGTDTFTGVAQVLGSAFADTFVATGASQGRFLGNGFTFIGGAGDDQITGGGTDLRWDFNVARYDFATGPASITLGTSNVANAPKTDLGTAVGDTSIGNDTLHFVEIYRGTNFADTFTAFKDFQGFFGAFNSFEGGGGNDAIVGNGSTRVSFVNATSGVNVTWTPGGAVFTGAGTATGDSSVGTDTFTGVYNAQGSGFADTFVATGAHGFFYLEGRGGDDTIAGSQFNNSAQDFDTVGYRRSTSGVTFTLGAATTVTGDASVGVDTISQVERFDGSHFNDTYTADQNFASSYGLLNVFAPNGGDDTITGNGHTRLDYSTSSGNTYAGITVDLAAGTAQSTLAGDAAGIGVDTFTGVNGVTGGIFDDILLGSNSLAFEYFQGGQGNDQIDGRGGPNLVAYRPSTGAVTVNLTTGIANDGMGGTDTLANIDAVIGSEFNDVITGNAHSNGISGQGGDDIIFGGAGNDVLIGGTSGGASVGFAFGVSEANDAGNDTIDGGLGRDMAVYAFNASAYSISRSGGTIFVTKGGETDTLTSIEQLGFADKTNSFDQRLTDFNGDGKRDGLFVDSSGNLAAWTVNNVTLTGGGVIGNPGRQWAFQGSGDFDGDGVTDILFRNSTTGEIATWQLNGTTITSGSFLGNPGRNFSIVAVADFNGDDRSDILFRDVNGTYATWNIFNGAVAGGGTIGNPGSSYKFAGVGDFNADSHADILFAKNDGTYATWLLNGSSIIGGGNLGSAGNFVFKAVADFNGDGSSDVLFQGVNGDYATWNIVNNSISGGGTIGNPGSGFSYAGAGDFNGDLTADIAFRDASGTIATWNIDNTSIIGGGGLGNPGPSYSLLGESPNASIGLAETAVFQRADGTVATWNVPNSQIVSGATLGVATGYTAIARGDFNGDHQADVLFRNANGDLATWQTNGVGITGGGTIGNPGASWSFAGAGDFNGDGTTDILFKNVDGNYALWGIKGTSIVSGGTIGNPGGTWALSGVGDFDGDGKSDLLFRDAGGNYAAWQLSGSQIVGGGTIGNPGASFTFAGIGDLNGDGRSDIVFKGNDGAYATWNVSGTSIVGGGTIGNPGASWTLAGVTDVTGDHHADLVFKSVSGQTFATWHLNDTQIIGGATIGDPGAGWQLVI